MDAEGCRPCYRNQEREMSVSRGELCRGDWEDRPLCTSVPQAFPAQPYERVLQYF